MAGEISGIVLAAAFGTVAAACLLTAWRLARSLRLRVADDAPTDPPEAG